MYLGLNYLKAGARIFEIGSGDSNIATTREGWKTDHFFTLFEPNPFNYQDLIIKTQKYNNVKVYNCGIAAKTQKRNLILAGGSSYFEGCHSPIERIFRGKFSFFFQKYKHLCDCYTIDKFDDGGIDILYLSMEGEEYSVFQYLKSRPAIIYMNDYSENDYGYSLPNYHVISNFMKINDYSYIKARRDEVIFTKNSSIKDKTIAIQEIN